MGRKAAKGKEVRRREGRREEKEGKGGRKSAKYTIPGYGIAPVLLSRPA